LNQLVLVNLGRRLVLGLLRRPPMIQDQLVVVLQNQIQHQGLHLVILVLESFIVVA
jgi:hypothetical protein